MMKRLGSAIVFVIGLTLVTSSFGQDALLRQTDESNGCANGTTIIENVADKIQRVCDIAKREALQLTSRRTLKHRCGRYWVDSYSELIAPNDRAIGIWGIDGDKSIGYPNNARLR